MPLEVLYLDDEATLCGLFEEIFSSPEVVIRTFTEPRGFFDYLASDVPDLIFLDYRLPGTTGDIIATRLNPSIPVAMITGDLQVTPRAKFAKIFHKPYDVKAIGEFISSFAQSR